MSCRHIPYTQQIILRCSLFIDISHMVLWRIMLHSFLLWLEFQKFGVYTDECPIKLTDLSIWCKYSLNMYDSTMAYNVIYMIRHISFKSPFRIQYCFVPCNIKIITKYKSKTAFFLSLYLWQCSGEQTYARPQNNLSYRNFLKVVI